MRSALASLALTPLDLAAFDTVTRSDVILSSVTLTAITAASLRRTGTVIGGAHLGMSNTETQVSLGCLRNWSGSVETVK